MSIHVTIARDLWKVRSSFNCGSDMRMIKDDPWSRQPLNAWNAERGVKVHKLVERDCQTTLKLMTDQTHINQDTTILQILHEDLAKTKICTKFVPYSVRDEQQGHRVKICEIHIFSICTKYYIPSIHNNVSVQWYIYSQVTLWLHVSTVNGHLQAIREHFLKLQ